MKTRGETKNGKGGRQRTILVVDRNDKCDETLKEAWSRLGLVDELKVEGDSDKALNTLRDGLKARGRRPVAAVVLDPEATGEDTGSFLREVRKSASRRELPVLLWTRDGETYDLLAGKGVDTVLRKPMVLRLIQSLDSACDLRVRSAGAHAHEL